MPTRYECQMQLWWKAVAPNEISYAVASKAYETLGDWPKVGVFICRQRQPAVLFVHFRVMSQILARPLEY